MIDHLTYQQYLFGIDYESLANDIINIEVVSPRWVKDIKVKYIQLAGKQYYPHPKEKLKQISERDINKIVNRLVKIKDKDIECQEIYIKVKQHYKNLMILMESDNG